MVAQFSRKMAPVTGRQRAAMAVEARRGALGMSRDELASAAQVDPKTVYNLEKNGRWPIARSRSRIEAALGWPSGEMERIASAPEGRPEPLVPPEVEQAIRRARRDDQWKDAVMEALETIARERRAGQAGDQSQRQRRAG